MAADYKIINNESNHHFELLLPGDPAYIQYSIRGGVLALYYIFVPPEERGKGLSPILIEYALDFAKERALKVEVYCSYINRYMEVKALRGEQKRT
jgi:predicted GNAT family acetyltransferase